VLFFVQDCVVTCAFAIHYCLWFGCIFGLYFLCFFRCPSKCRDMCKEVEEMNVSPHLDKSLGNFVGQVLKKDHMAP
jgi:hypothetical protein